jgi:NADPH:quinone reductase-like Zn-dependent oxidoreductase
MIITMEKPLMKAARIHTQAGPIQVEDAPYPQTGVGDVIVKVHAAGITPHELDWPVTWTDRAGRDRTPTVPAHEVSGVIAELGYGTTGFEVGDRVFGLTDRNRDGAAAEYIAAEARDLALLPESIDYVTAAALPMTGLTAWQGLFVHANVKRGQTVLIHGAAGGVGSLAVQLAKDVGAHVIGTGRAAAEDVVRELGADTFVDVSHFEDAGPADLVFDTIGGDVLARSAAVVAPGGALVSISAPSAGGVYFIVEPNREQLNALAQFVVQGRLKPRIGAVFPVSEAQKAFDAKGNGVLGKVVLTV